MKEITYNKCEPRKLRYKNSFAEATCTVEVDVFRSKGLRARGSGQAQALNSGDAIPSPRRQTNIPLLTADKERDLRAMFKFMPAVDKQYYLTIMHGARK